MIVRREKGFTLVELLLAMTLMGLLMALAYGGLQASWKASERGQHLLEQSSKLRITHQFIRKQLNLMLPLVFSQEDTADGEVYRFLGAPDQIIFVGPMPGYLARGGPQVQLLALIPGEEGQDLVFSHAPLGGFELEYLDEVEPVVLLKNLRGGAFQFLELDETGEPVGWVSDWTQPGVLPRSVRIELEYPEGHGVEWPQLIASVRLDPAAIQGAGSDSGEYSRRIQEMIRRSGSRGDGQ